MKNIFLLGSLVLISYLSSCEQEKQKPEGLISQEEFESILYDIHLAEGIATAANLNPVQSQEAFDSLFVQIAGKYDIDTATFNRSFTYYTKDLSYTQNFYNRLKARMEGEAEEARKLADSIGYSRELPMSPTEKESIRNLRKAQGAGME